MFSSTSSLPPMSAIVSQVRDGGKAFSFAVVVAVVVVVDVAFAVQAGGGGKAVDSVVLAFAVGVVFDVVVAVGLAGEGKALPLPLSLSLPHPAGTGKALPLPLSLPLLSPPTSPTFTGTYPSPWDSTERWRRSFHRLLCLHKNVAAFLVSQNVFRGHRRPW